MLPEPSQFLFVKMLYAGKVSTVPTTNFILKWIRNEVGAHKSDENLTEAEAEKIARIGIAQAWPPKNKCAPTAGRSSR